MADGRELIKEAVKDAQSLKDAAIEAAKHELVESLTPSIRAFVEKTLAEKRGVTGRVGQSQRADYLSPKTAKWEESAEKGAEKMADKEKKHDKELDLESLTGFFGPAITEEPDPDADPDADPMAAGHGAMGGGIPTLGEEPDAHVDVNVDPDAAEKHEGEPEDESLAATHHHGEDDAGDFKHKVEGVYEDADPDADPDMKKEAKKAEKEKEKMDEEIEISEAELHKVYEAALQTEVQVKKGFSDMTKAGELEELDPAAGLLDVKKGDKAWNEEEPPHKQDFTVKEMIARGLAENKSLKTKNAKLAEMVQTLAAKLHEVNLFNAKVLHVNRFLNSPVRLTAEQKKVCIESLDKARSIQEVKSIYEALAGSFKASQALQESKNPRKPAGNVQRVAKSGSPDPKVLSESVDKNQTTSQYNRLRQLAGLLK